MGNLQDETYFCIILCGLAPLRKMHFDFQIHAATSIFPLPVGDSCTSV